MDERSMERPSFDGARGTADVETARTLFAEYARMVGEPAAFPGLEHELATLPGDYAPPAGEIIVARVGSVVAGCVAFRPLVAPDVAEVKRLYVRAPFRGHGLAEQLMQAALVSARNAGYTRIRLDTLASMQAAQRLYERLGFVEIGPYHEDALPGMRFMELRLTVGEGRGGG